jgi:hypothetical protein
MFQRFSDGINMLVWDLDPDGVPNEPRRKVDGVPIPSRNRAGDPPLPPQKVLMPYHVGAEACECNPLRYRAVLMGDEDHAELVRRFHERAGPLGRS